jgi:hypothetical protein
MNLATEMQMRPPSWLWSGAGAGHVVFNLGGQGMGGWVDVARATWLPCVFPSQGKGMQR